ncbi:MAG: TPM domain-containing protein [Chthoniobacterales bacterium]
MKCPACATLLPTPVPRCPQCKLSLQRLDLKFGLVPRHSRYLSDRSGALALPEMDALRKDLRLFEKKFPQILLSVLVTELPIGTKVNEYSFWMANRARFSSVEKTQNDNFDLLLVIDVVSKKAALVSGYGLEPYVSEEDLQDALQPTAAPLRAGKIADGIRACIEALTAILREASARAAKPQELELAEL